MIQVNQRYLGASGIPTPPLGVGTNKWGTRGKSKEDIFGAFQSSMDAGLNLFDTAEVYAAGNSERFLGEFTRRDPRRVLIASKFAPWPTRLTLRQYLRALDATLSRLGVGTVDLYYIHFSFSLLGIDALMDMMAHAVRSGKVRAVGVSNFSARQMRQAAARLARYDIPLAANQVCYNLLNRRPEVSGVLEACRELNVALVAYRPLAGGALGQHEASIPSDKLAPLLKTLTRIAQNHGKSVSQVALNWLLQRDEHVIPIPGATSRHHALENADTLTRKLNDEEFTAIDQDSSPWKR